MSNRTRKLILLTLVVTSTLSLRAQGSLTPDSSPAPTQKSLQEIWGKIESLQTEVDTLRTAEKSQSQLFLALFQDKLPWAKSDVVLGNDSGTSLAYAPNGTPSISFTNNDGKLSFAQHDGTSWKTEIIDMNTNSGTFSSLAFGPGGKLGIAYHDADDRDLRFASYDGAKWTNSVVASKGTVGLNPTLKYTHDGKAFIAYINETSKNLKTARFEKTGWVIEIVNENAASEHQISLAFSARGSPAISFTNYEDGEISLALAQHNGLSWQTNKTPSPLGHRLNTSLAFSPQGTPTIAFMGRRTSDPTDLHLIGFAENKWTNIQTVDTGRLDSTCSLAFSPNGMPAIAYLNNFTLRYTYYNGANWSTQVVDESNDAGYFTSLAFCPNGQPSISYTTDGNDNLRFAKQTIPSF